MNFLYNLFFLLMDFKSPGMIQGELQLFSSLLLMTWESGIVESRAGGGGSYFPYILLNQIQTMFSQLAKRSARVLPADLCTDHAHYVKNHKSTVFRRNKNMAIEGGTVSQYYILVIRKFIDLCRFSDIVCGFLFLLNNFPLQSLEYATYSSV